MKAVLYKRPDGRKENIWIANINEDDRAWFQEKYVRISMEDIGVGYAIWADVGLLDEEGEPREVTYVTRGDELCADALHKVRLECEQMLKEVEHG